MDIVNIDIDNIINRLRYAIWCFAFFSIFMDIYDYLFDGSRSDKNIN